MRVCKGGGFGYVRVRMPALNIHTWLWRRANRLPDGELLELASGQGRLPFTHDIRFKALAEDWQRSGRTFAGLIYGHAEGASIGQYVRDLEIVAKAVDWAEVNATIIHPPLRATDESGPPTKGHIRDLFQIRRSYRHADYPVAGVHGEAGALPRNQLHRRPGGQDHLPILELNFDGFGQS